MSNVRVLICKKQEMVNQLNEVIVDKLSENVVNKEIEEANRYTFDIKMAFTKLSKIIKELKITTTICILGFV